MMPFFTTNCQQAMSAFSCEVLATKGQARVTRVQTAHGEFITPTFMPVATKAAINCMNTQELAATGSQIILGGNTYHMLLAPGMETIQRLGGMHRMMAWDGPMLTDSGGFQVFSLSKNSDICKIDDKGARFKHPITGQVIRLTPQTSIQAQKIIGADIIMAFDECTPENGGRAAALAALARTHRWLKESIIEHERDPNSAYGYPQALFGIIQGGSFEDLRLSSTEAILAANTPGVAIGGEVIGFDMAKTREILSWVTPHLPANKPRYTMGVGLNPQDLIDVVAHGVDIFDCVAPTRNARHGSLYHGELVVENNWLRFEPLSEQGRVLIKKSCYTHDDTPILEGCDCYTCQHHTRAYLHYLYKQKQNLFLSLACIHNIRVLQRTCELMREIIQGSKPARPL